MNEWMDGWRQFTPISVVDANKFLRVSVFTFLTVSPCPITASPVTPPRPLSFYTYLARVTAKFSLQGKDPQPQHCLITAGHPLLQDVFPKLQVKLMSCPALSEKEMQE